MDERQILAQLLMRGQGQGMGPGNHMADHYQQKADDKVLGIGAAGAGTAGLSGAALLSLIMGEPLDAALLGLGAHTAAGVTDDAINARRMYQGGADMWSNQFGSGQPAQGMPGTPGGPAWRR